MNRLELMHDLALSIYKLFFLVTRKVRFLAMTMSEQARHCSFGLTKTFFFVPRKVRFLAKTIFEQARHCSFGLTKTVLFSFLEKCVFSP